MTTHSCRCVTAWDEEKGHPVYLEACSLHRSRVPDGWMLAPSKPRKPVKSSA